MGLKSKLRKLSKADTEELDEIIDELTDRELSKVFEEDEEESVSEPEEEPDPIIIREGENRTENVRKKKVRRKINPVPVLLILVMLLVALVACVLIFCRVSVISVYGLSNYTPEEILRECGIESGENLLFISGKRVEKNLISAFPYIEKIELRKNFPTGIRLMVTEGTIKYSIEKDGAFTYVSKYGKLLESGPAKYDGSILLKGGEIEKNDGYIKYKDEYIDNAFRAICDFLNEREGEMDAITEIDIRDVYNLSMIYDNRIRLVFGGTSDMRYKMNFGMNIIGGSGIGSDEFGTLDLSNSKDTNRAYFSPSTQDAVLNPVTVNINSKKDGNDWTSTFAGAGRIIDGVDQVQGEPTPSPDPEDIEAVEIGGRGDDIPDV
ncbi:MAG: FtsQ-type POTRA domain-containing protein [Clostridia bacterium]|nr:FtsQ-type POTRA domain-containing protein [Clostridia bacterium]